MDGLLDLALLVALVVFMAGSLLEMGLRLPARDALAGLRAPLFLGYGLLFGFVVGPALALLVARVLPLEEPYAIGLVLLGLTPCAPFLPAMARRARGDEAAVPAMMLLAAIGTVALLPFAVPAISEDLTADPVAVARPLLLFVLLPLAVGIAVRTVAPGLALAVQPAVRAVAAVATVATLALCLVIYGADLVSTVGTYAIAAQVLFLVAITVAAYALSPGLARDRRAVLALGLSTRNVGAALAPLFGAAAIDDRAVVMVVLAVPIQILVALTAAGLMARSVEPYGRAARRGP